MTEYSEGYGPEEDGNTILLHMGNNEYIYIGARIFSFKSLNPIVSFISLIGNNDVPYPYAIDDKGNIYMLIEDVIIKFNDKIKKQMKEYDNPYDYYYNYRLFTPDYGRIVENLHFRNIKKFYIGYNCSIMTYNISPDENYNKFIECGDSVFIVDTSDQKHVLTKQNYIELMKSFEEINSFEPLKILNIFQ